MSKQREIERVLGKYRERRLVGSGEPLELHRAVRERLYDAVEQEYGTDMSRVPTADNAEEFAKTLAWQSGMSRWWHRMIPQIGMVGTCAVALLIIFLVANRSDQAPQREVRSVNPAAESENTKDFLGASAVESKVGADVGRAPADNASNVRPVIVAPAADHTILSDVSDGEAASRSQPLRSRSNSTPEPASVSPTAPAPAPRLKIESMPAAKKRPRPAPIAPPSFTSPTVAPVGSSSAIAFKSSPSRDASGMSASSLRPAPAPRPSSGMSAQADTTVEPAGPARKLGANRSEEIAVVLPPARPSPVTSTPLKRTARAGIAPRPRPAAAPIQIATLPPPTSLDVPTFEPKLSFTPTAPRIPVPAPAPAPLPTVMKTPAAQASGDSVAAILGAPNRVSSPASSLSDLRQTFAQTGASGRYRQNFNSPPRQTPLKRFDLLVKGNTVTIRDSDGSIYNGKVQGNPSNSDGSFGFQVKGTHRATRQSVSFTGRYAVTAPGAAAESSAFNQRAQSNRNVGKSRRSPATANVVGQLLLAGKHRVELKAAASR